MFCFKGSFWKFRMDGLIFFFCIKDVFWNLENCLVFMKLDDFFCGIFFWYFEEENLDVRKREKYVWYINM